LSDNGQTTLETDELAVPSAFADHLGITVLERRRGFCRLACIAEPQHLNRSNVMHGGVLLALIDHAGGLADSWTQAGEEPRRSMTIDLNCRFTRPVAAGARVIATARIVSEGRSIYFASTEIHDEAGALVAFGSSTHKRHAGSRQAKD
jgi:uncharacterized protein (TIGR00369 family)